MPSDNNNNTKEKVAFGLIGAAAVAVVGYNIHQSSKASEREKRKEKWEKSVREAENEGQPFIADSYRKAAKEEGFDM